MANVYQVNIEGEVQEVTTVKEVKALLGDSKVTAKAIEAGEYPMVTIADEAEEQLSMDDTTEDTTVEEPTTEEDTVEEDTTEEVEEPTTDEDVEDDTTEEPVEEDDLQAKLVGEGYVPGATAILSDNSTNEEFLEWLFEANLPEDQVTITSIDYSTGNVEVKGYDGAVDYSDLTIVEAPKKKHKPTVDVSADGYPEVGTFADETAIKKYVKALSNEQLEEWCTEAGATWTHNDNPSINRMRMAMAIKAVHFPHLAAGKGSGKSKKKSKYGHYSMEDLVAMVLDNDVEVPDAKGDPRIERMYMIVALKKAGILE